MLMLLMAGVCLPASCTEDSIVQVRGFLAGRSLAFGFWAFGFGFLGERRLFGCGRLLEGKIAERGKMDG
jgi:hypothetical protein